MKKIVVFGGSTSSTSINKRLAVYAASLLENVTLEIIDFDNYKTVHFNVDTEKEGFPSEMIELSELFTSADGFVISLAEHNGSYASEYKNVIDWLSRINRKVFNDKPMLLMASSPGARGGANVLQSALQYYPHLGARIISNFSLPNFHENFKENVLDNEELSETLINQVKEFSKNL